MIISTSIRVWIVAVSFAARKSVTGNFGRDAEPILPRKLVEWLATLPKGFRAHCYRLSKLSEAIKFRFNKFYLTFLNALDVTLVRTTNYDFNAYFERHPDVFGPRFWGPINNRSL